jgi:DNA-binding transcriptional LysR family regulator
MQTVRLFCDVAGCRSFSEAARRHRITQSAASQRVGALERRLGTTLIDRSVRPLALTPAGEEFFEGCREMVQRYDRLLERVTQLKRAVEGEVRVDAIYSAGIDWLNHVKEQFQAQTPRVKLVVEYKQPAEVYAAVRAGNCDLGIVSYPRHWREVGVIALRNEQMAVVCGPGHRLAGRKRVRASELDGLPLVTFEASLPVAMHIRRYLREHGAKPEIANVFDNIDTVKNAVAITDQYSILPTRTVGREVQAGVLRVVELEPELVRPMGLIYARPAAGGSAGRRGTGGNGSSGRAFRPAVQAFVDFLLHESGPNVQGRAETAGAAQPSLVGAK